MTKKYICPQVKRVNIDVDPVLITTSPGVGEEIQPGSGGSADLGGAESKIFLVDEGNVWDNQE